MLPLLNRLSVRNRIWALVVLLVGSIAATGFVDSLAMRDEMWQEKEQRTRQLVESGYSVLAHFHAMQVRGELTEAQAQASAKETIKAMRYGESEYFWLTDVGTPFPKMLMHPTMPELNGQTLDANIFNTATESTVGAGVTGAVALGTKNLFAASVELVNANGKGFVQYEWPKPRRDSGVSQDRFPKVSYVQKFEPWGWIIGSGVYVDEVDAVVRGQIGHALLVAAGSGVVFLVIAGLIANSITHPLHRTVSVMRRIGIEEDDAIQRLPVEGQGEIAELAKGFNDMLRQLEERDRILARHRESLEAEVASRTAELHESNLKLKQELIEHRKAEELVRESRVRMRALIDATNESVLLLDKNGNILAINAFGANRFGYTVEDITGKNFYSLLPKGVAQSRSELVQSVFDTGLPQHSQDNRGSVFFSNSLYPVRDAAGAVASVAVYAKDVTEQHQIEEVNTLFSKLDSVLLKLHMNVETIAQMFCEEVLPVFDLAGAWIGRTDQKGQLVPVAYAMPRSKGLPTAAPADLDPHMATWVCPFAADVVHEGSWKIVMSDEPCCQSCSACVPSDKTYPILLLPLLLRGVHWGVLALYGSNPKHFDVAQMPLRLTAVATRLGYSLESAMQQEWLSLLDTALAGVGNSVLFTDAQGNVKWVNRAFTQLSGYEGKYIVGKNVRLLLSDVQAEDFYKEFWQAIDAGANWHGDVENVRPDGSHYTVSQTVTPLLNSEGKVSHYVAIMEDITMRRAEEERVRHSANFDVLTDLPNRSLFLDRLGQAVALARRGGTPGALMFLDLDHFKEVNDQLGHAAGDALLKSVAGRLRENVRESDTVARLGGDEFTVILPALQEDSDATRVARAMVAALGEPFDIAGNQVHIGVSIGIALFPRHGTTVERLLIAADEAMYLSKQAGRNRYTFVPNATS